LQIKILMRKPRELKFEVEGESHTLCNLLEKVLLEDETVEIAGYRIPHPLTSNPIFYIRTKGRRNPETALKEAVNKILKRNREFKRAFRSALREWRKAEKGRGKA